MPFLSLFFYAFTLWLGAYLLARRSPQLAVQLAGWGLLAYALALGTQIALGQAPLFVLLAPPLLWIGAALHLLPEARPGRPLLIRLWAVSAIPLAILAQFNAWFAALVLLALLACAGLIAAQAWRERRAGSSERDSLAIEAGGPPPHRYTFAVLAMLALFVGLSSGLVILPLNWLPSAWAMALLGTDLILLGVTIIAWDAFNEGATIRRHLARSFVAALYYAGSLALIGALFAAWYGDTSAEAATDLVLALVTFGILTQSFSDSIQAGLDRLTLPPPVNAERQALRQAAEALPLNAGWQPSGLPEGEPGETPAPSAALPDDEQFTRWTRRAISNLGDLSRLAASPLLALPMVMGGTPLERARSLKALLTAQIQALKPAPEPGVPVADFETGDAWRYYNALYYPYVRGLKPYTRRLDYARLDPAERAALEWFQAAVPERTLHNWQNSAARLIAGQLRREAGQPLNPGKPPGAGDASQNWQ